MLTKSIDALYSTCIQLRLCTVKYVRIVESDCPHCLQEDDM